MVDGPPTYLLGYSFARESLERAEKNLQRIIGELAPKGLDTMILDHHLLRDLNYRDAMKPIYDVGVEGVMVVCAAEFLGLKVEMLEARRRGLYTTSRCPYL